uniref:THAP-type domain-containing protein n=1 Tax=Anopheles dirus TaxID=7168 RepID=A0A182NM39_9DIPT
MRNCFVFQCDRQHRDNPKRAMFNTPKDPEKFELWSKALPNYRPLQPHDRVCEKHFKPTDIMREWTYNIEGKTEKLPRTKPVLQPDAVPCYVDAFDATTASKRRRKAVETEHTAATESDEVSVSVVVEGRQFEELSDIQEPEQAVIIMVGNASSEACEEERAVKPNGEVVVLSIAPDTAERELIFEELYDNIFEVELPCTLWGVHRDPDRKYVAFSRFEWNGSGAVKLTSLMIDCGLRCEARVNGELTFGRDLAATLTPDSGDTEKTIRLAGLEELLDTLDQSTANGNSENDIMGRILGNNFTSTETVLLKVQKS